MNNSFATIIREALQDAHKTLEDTMADVTEEVAHFQPNGKALPIGAAYAHVAVSEDILLQEWVRKEKTLIDTGWADKLGLSEMHPAMDENWEKNYTEWVRNVKVDLPQLKAYAQAVYKQSDDYLAGLSDEDMLSKKVDLSAWGMGEWTLARYVLNMLSAHVNSLTGEISAAKGLQDLKGYPF